VLTEIPNSKAISFCVIPRASRSRVAHSRAVGGRGCDAGDRLTVRPTAPTPVVPHPPTRRPRGAEPPRAGYCVHHDQAPLHRGTRAASRRSRPHERQRVSHRRAGCGQNCGQSAIGVLASRAESAHFLRRGRDSNPWEPCDSSGFQDRRIRPLCHPSEAMNPALSSVGVGRHRRFCSGNVATPCGITRGAPDRGSPSLRSASAR
jgi:hypothetical protein